MSIRDNARERRVSTYIPIFSIPKSQKEAVKFLSKPQKWAMARAVEERGATIKPRKKDRKKSKANAKQIKSVAAKRPYRHWKGSELDKVLANAKYDESSPDGVSVSGTNSQFGFLVLERTTFEPDGTVPSKEVVKHQFLAPGAEVELTKKTWSKYELEFVEATDQVRNEERESSSTSNREFAESTKDQSQFKLNMGASTDVVGTGGFYTAKAKVTSDLTTARDTSASENTKEITKITETASARINQEHKVTYTQRTEFSSEYSITEHFKNPNSTHGVILNLRKLLQKWRIRHEQVGVRLCLDVMVKDPGCFLRQSALPDVFNPAGVPDPDPNNPPPNAPPVPKEVITESKDITFRDAKETKIAAWYIPPGYIIDFATAIGADGSGVTFSTLNGQPGFIRGDQMGLGYYAGTYVGNHVNNYDAGVGSSRPQSSVTVTAYFKRTNALLNAWVDAARPFKIEEERRLWQVNNSAKVALKRALESGSTIPPTQVLRCEERDQLFSAVTNFLATGYDTPRPIGASGLPPSDIRWLHEALDWEATGSFLYPFWWDTSVFGIDPAHTNDFISGLKHADFIRRQFVRASWARVMVPVRPGYEKMMLIYMYGDDMKEALKESNDQAPAPIGDLVKAYVAIREAEKKGGEFGIKDDAGSSLLKPSEPKIVAEWSVTVPTDEVVPEMSLVCDEHGELVNIAEPYLRGKQQAHIRRLGAENVASDAIAKAIVEGPNAGHSRVEAESGELEYEPDSTSD